MNEYMVIVKFLVAFHEEFVSLIPSQRNEINRLMEEGILTDYCLSSDRDTLWMTIRAESSNAVAAILKTMPLIKFMRYEIVGLMFHNHTTYTPMQFSMN
jgi:hypothetical protein